MAETGLNQNRNRDYDPMVGRYLQGDPIGFEGGSLSLYEYAKANPLTCADPSGEGIVNCGRAVSNLIKATGRLATKVAASLNCDSPLDKGHRDAIKEAATKLREALSLVQAHCADYEGAAAAIAAGLAVLGAAGDLLAFAAA
jgi:uncharacterized protein RhaS with RHS repeats